MTRKIFSLSAAFTVLDNPGFAARVTTISGEMGRSKKSMASHRTYPSSDSLSKSSAKDDRVVGCTVSVPENIRGGVHGPIELTVDIERSFSSSESESAKLESTETLAGWPQGFRWIEFEVDRRCKHEVCGYGEPTGLSVNPI